MTLLFFIAVHIGSEIGDHGIVLQGEEGLEIKELRNIIRELGVDFPVQFRGNMGAGFAAHPDQAALVAAGGVPQDFGRDPDAGFLNRVDQRTGAEQMMREAEGFRVPDFLRAGAVVVYLYYVYP